MYPVLPRLFAGAGALAASAYLIFLQPARLLDEGRVLSAQAMVASAIPLVLFLAWMALHPASLQRALSRVSKVRLTDAGHASALLLLVLTIYYVVGIGSLFGGAYAYEDAASGEGVAEMDELAIIANLLLNVLVLVLAIVLFVSFVHDLGPRDALRTLGLRAHDAPRALVVGVASAVGAILLIALAGVLLQRADVHVPENERALAIASSVTLGGALAIATLSSLSEEIFFRGFLQPRIGVLGQAALFSLAHLSYANLSETLITFALALAFALLYKWTKNLWAPIAAHFAFNLIMLLVGMAAT